MTPAAQQTDGARRPRGRVGCLIVLVLWLVIVEGLLRVLPVPAFSHDELVARYHLPEVVMYQPHPYLPFTLTPGFESPPNRRNQVRVNQAGFRGPEVPLAKPEGELRIACFGGSSTFGAGPSSDAMTWPAQLERLLRERFPGRAIRVLNFGTPHWTSFESLARLSTTGLAYDPDVVLVYHAVNDTWASLGPDPQPDNTHTRKVWEIERPHVLDRTLEGSMTYRLWRRYLSGDTLDRRKIHTFVDVDVGKLDVEPPHPPQGFESFRRNLTSMVAVARYSGAAPVLLTQASRPVDADDMPLLSKERPQAAPERYRKVQAILDITAELAVPVVREVAAAQDVPLIDVREHMETVARERIAAGQDERMYTDTVHVTDLGARLIAEYVAAQLVEQGVVR